MKWNFVDKQPCRNSINPSSFLRSNFSSLLWVLSHFHLQSSHHLSLFPSRNKKRQQKEVSQFKFIKKSNIHLPILFAIILSYLIFPSSNLLFYVFLSLRLSSLSLLIYSLTSVLGFSLFSIYILLLLHQLFLPFRLPVSQIIHSGGKFSFPIFIIRDVFLVCVVVYLSVFVLIMIYKLCVLGVLGSFHFFK